MPSIALANNSSDSKDKKEKNMKKNIAFKTSESESANPSKKKNLMASEPEDEIFSDRKQKKKDKKKRKAVDIHSEDDERSETSSELVEPVNLKVEKTKKKNKKAKVDEEENEEGEGEGEVAKAEDPNAISRFRISGPLREKLKSKGIESLFPIQAKTFDDIHNGSDLVGRARTGQGKTLAFVLPILESLTNGPANASRKTGNGRPPSVLVLLPTRELACQVYNDFKVYGETLGLTSCCLYGGASYHPQEMSLKRGVDIVVGTPGRIKDHIERGNIDLSLLKFRVLDEADEMLRMGFVEDVELILGKVQDVSKVQTLLFSATLPDWVKHISSRFLKPTKKTIDLVGNEKMKASTSVRHIVLPCFTSAIPQLIPDIIRCYSSGGRTIIFTEKRESANELAGLLHGARALHGEIQQSQREVTLSGFRSGKFMTLVATNVAARGLDINDVQLIIQCEPPRDVEAYIHRSGRTGRAGNTGVAVMLCDPRRSNISKIERESGVKFEHIAAPQPADIAKAVGVEAAEKITQVSDSVVPAFKSAAEDLLNTSGLSAVELLAKALAKAAGYTEIKSRSLLTSMENHVTLLLEAGRPFYTPSFAFGILRRFLPDDKIESVKGMTLTADGNGAVFDVPAADLDTFLAGQENAANVRLEVLQALPPLQERDQSRGRFGGGGRGRGDFSDRNGGGRFSGGRGGRGGGFSDRRNGRFSNGFGGGKGRSGGKKW
ncbi:hypothetical protein P3X46_023716 [Hevea brasiliensis]|uniref:RNA helicase n=1 Tax=Hevea brasiliensis TaxID=3981 RepID=A0ABQ9LDM1_HEVBR|nr:DEAD-box ATP-dependent RNA helicase 7 [Hevea brasiliensis]KAJ9164102.1 hypothetical protein P3X46_023716 [Hevea brasiliensis]